MHNLMRNLKGASDTPARVACRGLIHDNVCATILLQIYEQFRKLPKEQKGALLCF